MSSLTPELNELLRRYSAGLTELREAIGDLTPAQVRIPVAPGRWSVLEVVCHIADFELVYADRMKRVIVEDRPTMFSGDPDQFAAGLAYNQRDLEEELQVIASVRKQVVRVLTSVEPAVFRREGIHTADGPISLATLLGRIAGHIPHHAEFIRQKKIILSERGT